MKKKIANSFKHILTAAGKNWMEAMRLSYPDIGRHIYKLINVLLL